MRLPALIDIHAHLRDPGATHKEDWDSGTAAALAGGFTTVLAMPNTQPPLTNAKAFQESLDAAESKARCDFGIYLGAGPANAAEIAVIAPRSAGLKLYLDQTYGELRLDDMTLWMPHFEHWPLERPIAAHAESRTLAAVLLMAELYDRHIHICHVSRREEILLIRAAKEKGLQVTCEVCPHHLFLCDEDIPAIGSGRSEVRPRLATAIDRDALWENMDVIDCFATDHAPHTLQEKDSDSPPPGFPGLETALPLLLNAVSQKRLTIDDLVKRFHENPKHIFSLPDQAETYIEVDLDALWEINGKHMYTRCGWTPFEGWQGKGLLQRVVLRGQTVYEDQAVLAQPGSGQHIQNF